jgi:hypothetical protein
VTAVVGQPTVWVERLRASVRTGQWNLYELTSAGMTLLDSQNQLQPQLAQTPDCGEPQGPRCNAAPTRTRKDGNREARDLVISELEIEQPERPVVGRVRDHERCAGSRAPLLLRPRHARALAGRRQRIVIHAPARLRVVARLGDLGKVGVAPHPQHDLAVGERRVRRLPRLSGHDANGRRQPCA